LKTVYFVQNKISKITGLGSVGATLRSLELGGNRIRVIALITTIVRESSSRWYSAYRRIGCASQLRGVMAWKKQADEARGAVYGIVVIRCLYDTTEPE
jgi:hypothetical protein